jgi:hypothetical protein
VTSGGVRLGGIRSASTSATTPDGTVIIRGLDGSAMHTHGGAPARLGGATFQVTNQSCRSRTIQAETVEHLYGRSCTEAPAQVRARPRSAGLLVDDGSQTESRPSVTVAPGADVAVSLGFSPSVQAYYTFCDRFAFRVRFRVDGDPLVVVAETIVTREEPLRSP